jgi:hypothetical protein
MVRKPSVSDDFWSTSTCDLDNSTVQSQRSISSISTSNQTLNCGTGIGSMSSNSDLVNNGKFSSYVILCFLLMYWEIMVLLIWCHLEIFMTPFLWVCVHDDGFLAGTSLVPGLVQFWLVRLSCKMYISWHAGLLLWNQTRLQWIGSGRSRDRTERSREPRLRCVTCTFYDEFIDWNPAATIHRVYRIKYCCFPRTKAKS